MFRGLGVQGGGGLPGSGLKGSGCRFWGSRLIWYRTEVSGVRVSDSRLGPATSTCPFKDAPIIAVPWLSLAQFTFARASSSTRTAPSWPLEDAFERAVARCGPCRPLLKP